MANGYAKEAAKELARPAPRCPSAATAASCARARWLYVEPDPNAIYFLSDERHRKVAI
jgi:hypothetical protein